MDQRTRKLMNMHTVLNPRDDADRRYVYRKEGGRRLTNSESNLDSSIQQLEDNIKKGGGRLVTATRNNTENTRTNRTEIIRKQK